MRFSFSKKQSEPKKVTHFLRELNEITERYDRKTIFFYLNQTIFVFKEYGFEY